MEEPSRTRLLELIECISSTKTQAHRLEQERREIADRMEVLRARLMLQIATARDDDGKPLYSNRELREAALTLALSEGEGYRLLRQHLWQLEDDRRRLEIELERLEDARLLALVDAGVQPATTR